MARSRERITGQNGQGQRPTHTYGAWGTRFLAKLSTKGPGSRPGLKKMLRKRCRYSTRTGTEYCSDGLRTVIVVFPGLTAVTIPLAFTVATRGFAD
jgi:hypothetical protein